MGGDGDPEDPDRLIIADEHLSGKQEMAGSDYQTASNTGQYNTQTGGGMGQGNDTKVKGEKPPRKKHNRFNGMSEEEVAKKLLPDLIAPDLDILIVS